MWGRRLRSGAKISKISGYRDQLTSGTPNRKAARQSPSAGTHSVSHRRPGADQAATGGRRLAVGHEESREQSQAARRHFDRRDHSRSLCFYFDETLGEIPYLGLKCGSVTPVGRGDIKRGGFVCAVSGKRRGKGSSREQSPYAEMCAGIRVVIAENIERIYTQNCQNLGGLTSTV